MKRILILFGGIFVLFVGFWIYRTFLRPVDPLQPEILELSNHFNESGLNVRPYAVRHGFSHSVVVAASGFQINDFPLAIMVDLCPNVQSAQEHYLSVKESPNLMHPHRNGRLVLYLPMWGDDTKNMANKVIRIFKSFKIST